MYFSHASFEGGVQGAKTNFCPISFIIASNQTVFSVPASQATSIECSLLSIQDLLYATEAGTQVRRQPFLVVGPDYEAEAELPRCGQPDGGDDLQRGDRLP